MSIFSPDFSPKIKTWISCSPLSISIWISERHLQMPRLNSCFHLSKHKQQQKPTSPAIIPHSVNEISILAVAHVKNLEVIVGFSLFHTHIWSDNIFWITFSLKPRLCYSSLTHSSLLPGLLPSLPHWSPCFCPYFSSHLYHSCQRDSSNTEGRPCHCPVPVVVSQ